MGWVLYWPCLQLTVSLIMPMITIDWEHPTTDKMGSEESAKLSTVPFATVLHSNDSLITTLIDTQYHPNRNIFLFFKKGNCKDKTSKPDNYATLLAYHTSVEAGSIHHLLPASHHQ